MYAVRAFCFPRRTLANGLDSVLSRQRILKESDLRCGEGEYNKQNGDQQKHRKRKFLKSAPHTHLRKQSCLINM